MKKVWKVLRVGVKVEPITSVPILLASPQASDAEEQGLGHS